MAGLREVRDFPATTTFCLLWIVVFVAMVATQTRRGSSHPSWTKWLVPGHRRRPSVWRPDAPRPGSWRILAADHFDICPFQRASPGVEPDGDVSARHDGGIMVWTASVCLYLRPDGRRRQSGFGADSPRDRLESTDSLRGRLGRDHGPGRAVRGRGPAVADRDGDFVGPAHGVLHGRDRGHRGRAAAIHRQLGPRRRARSWESRWGSPIATCSTPSTSRRHGEEAW